MKVHNGSHQCYTNPHNITFKSRSSRERTNSAILHSPPLTINPNANHCLLAFHRMKMKFIPFQPMILG